MDNSERHSDLKKVKNLIRIDVTLFLAGAIGAFTMNGYAHLEKYYQILDVPVDRLNFSGQKLLAYGGAGLGSYITALFFGGSLVGVLTLLMFLFEKPGKIPPDPFILPRWMARIKARTIELSKPGRFIAALCIVALFMGFASYLLISVPSDSGRKSAYKTISKCDNRTFIYKNLDRVEGCQVAESEDMVYIVQREKIYPKKVDFATLELPKEGLLRIQGNRQTLEYEY
jgi:hypothetical protein